MTRPCSVRGPRDNDQTGSVWRRARAEGIHSLGAVNANAEALSERIRSIRCR